jgi:hypothetical protein
VVEVGDDESPIEQEEAKPREVGRQGERKEAVGHGERRDSCHRGAQ